MLMPDHDHHSIMPLFDRRCVVPSLGCEIRAPPLWTFEGEQVVWGEIGLIKGVIVNHHGEMCWINGRPWQDLLTNCRQQDDVNC
jgi:hypothetical protein